MSTPAPPGGPETRKPRVLGGQLAPPAPAVQAHVPRSPRAIGSPAVADTPALLPGTAQVLPPPPQTPQPLAAPRHVPGQLRVGLKVDTHALARRFPAQDGRVLEAAAGVLATVVPEGFGWTQAQSLGLDAQKQYGHMVQRLLDASSADVVRTAPQHLSRLLTLLESCAEEFDPPTSLVGQWLRGKDRSRAIDTHRREIEQLRTSLAASVAELDGPIAETMAVRERLAVLADTLLGAGLACDWVASALTLPDEVQAALAERALALTRTATMARQQQAQAMAGAGNLDLLRDRIQDGVLIALPAWLATLAGLPAEPNDTQRFVVRDDLRQIIHRLKH